jgi:hypothetical protein
MKNVSKPNTIKKTRIYAHLQGGNRHSDHTVRALQNSKGHRTDTVVISRFLTISKLEDMKRYKTLKAEWSNYSLSDSEVHCHKCNNQH